jgi:hypothetical protein
MVEKELSSNSQFSPYNNNDNPNSNNNLKKNNSNNISEEDKDFINLINQFLPEKTLILLVSKNVKEIEKAISIIYDDLVLYNDDKDYNIFLNGISINDIIFTCSNICLYILKTNYIPPKIMVIDLMNIFITNNKYIEIIQAVKEFSECLISFIDYLGDSNQKLREKAEKIIFEYTKKTKSQNKVINLIINTPIKKNLIKSRNHLNGRYLMVSKFVNLGGYFKNNFENILKYAINGYALNKINVRDAALDIIITLYKYEGEKHFYIPDFYFPDLELEIEIKDGGSNPNMHHKIQAVDKVKERLKDKVMENQHKVHYIKIPNKSYSRFLKEFSRIRSGSITEDEENEKIIIT